MLEAAGSQGCRIEAEPSCAWKIAPVAATPSCRRPSANIERTPEATPAFSTATAFIAAVDIGDIVSAMPMPMQR